MDLALFPPFAPHSVLTATILTASSSRRMPSAIHIIILKVHQSVAPASFVGVM